jgi:outer membrane protein OmpA-like peptidoglycan-associated protein
MHLRRSLSALLISGSVLVIAGCALRSPPPPVVVPAAFTPLGVAAPYLSGDVIGGRKSRAAKMRAAGIRPLAPVAAPAYLGAVDTELRRQTAGIGVDVIRLPDGILVRIPAALTFFAGGAEVRPQLDATLLEIARTVKANRQTYVDVLAHTDTTGTSAVNQSLSEKRASAVASYLSRHGVAKARIASRGFGETQPLYPVDTTETQRAANRRVEIRLVPFRSTDAPAPARRRR